MRDHQRRRQHHQRQNSVLALALAQVIVDYCVDATRRIPAPPAPVVTPPATPPATPLATLPCGHPAACLLGHAQACGWCAVVRDLKALQEAVVLSADVQRPGDVRIRPLPEGRFEIRITTPVGAVFRTSSGYMTLFRELDEIDWTYRWSVPATKED